MSLDKKNVEDMLSLSPLQEGLLFHYISNKNEGYYLQQLCIRLSGDICIKSVEKAWRFVIDSNEMLRTVFRWKSMSHPVQIVLKDLRVPIEIYDLSILPIEEIDSRLTEIKENDRNTKLDIENNPLRISIIKINNKECDIVLCWHHIIFDGWSNGIILKEFINAYTTICSGSSLIKPVKAKYKDFVKWIRSQDKGIHRRYWEEYLNDFDERTSLPYDNNGLNLKTSMKSFISKLDGHYYEEINAFARENEITLASIIYCVWGVLLQKYNTSKDVVFGTTVSGRVAEIEGIDDMVGLFINTIPMRVSSKENEKIIELIKKIDLDLKQRNEYENTPLIDIESYWGMKSKESLFNSVVVIENYPIDNNIKHSKYINIDGFSIHETTNYDIALGVTVFDTLEFELSYNAAKFSDNTIKRVNQHFKNVLLKIISNPEMDIKDMSIASVDEVNQILYEFNKPINNKSKDDVVHKVFEKQVSISPNSVAVIHEGRSYTYNEINDKANILARLLLEKGVKPQEHVAIVLERSVYLIIAMLAVMKAGGVYIPIDHEYYSSRLDFIIKDANIKAILTNQKYMCDMSFQGTIVDVDDEEKYNGDNSNLPTLNVANDLLYIIYTSGTTGKPKGVMVTHRNVVNYVNAFQEEFNLLSKDVVLQQAPCSFDHSVEEIYPPLLNGAAIVIANKTDVLDTNRLTNIINSCNISLLTVQPLLLNEINKIPPFKSIHTFLSGADVLKPEYMSNLKKYARVYNTYGPTEATVCASYYNCSFENEIKTVLIGKPILNYKIFILNKDNMIMPIGIPGEICISGEGVAHGYVNNKELTNEKFIDNPFEPNSKIYRTGDRGKWLEDGNVEFLGRLDEQVKIRGFRIELGEIEFHLKKYPGVEDAVVLPVDSPNGIKSLAAYIKPTCDIDVKELRKQLSMSLPDYMMPSYYYKIDKIPRNNNSKTDVKELMKNKDSFECEPTVRTDRTISNTERVIMAMWKDILSVDNITVNDNFFDIGGNSILLMRMQREIEKEYKNEITIADLFTYTTISKLAEFIDKADEKTDKRMFDGFQSLPANYFENNMSSSGIGTINISLDDSLVKDLIRFSSLNEIELLDFLIATYSYLFTEISKQKVGTIQFLRETQLDCLPIKIDLNSINGFSDLFKLVNIKRNVETNNQLYTLQQAFSLDFQKEKHEILPLVCMNSDLSIDLNVLRVFDIVLIINVDTQNEHITLTCKYNNKILKKANINILVLSYIELFKQFAKKMRGEN